MTVEILTGDMRALMVDMPDESFDLILTDCPYGETSLQWDRWVPEWPSRVRRLLKKTGSMWCFGSMRMFLEHAAEFQGWRFVQDVVWEKHNGSGFAADRFRRVHECACQFYRDDAVWSGVFKDPQVSLDALAKKITRRRQPLHTGKVGPAHYKTEEGGPRLLRSVIYARSEHGRADHPTQKPIAVVEPLLLYACPPGGKVLDPFAGSGTTGIVARRHGRDAVLIEGKPEYVEIIRRRIADDAPLFAGAAE